jgi:phospholipid/cholesterol/gamma-HCH transport system substrate-binding protein
VKRIIAAVVVVVALAAAAVVLFPSGTPERTLVAHFSRTVGIFEGSDVRVLGVRVGRVVSVRPEGRTVRVGLRYDAAQRVPADVQAVIIPPSIVSDRYVQLTPAYTSGPVLADGAELPVSRTAAPMEIDEVYRALDEFNKALGPQGANANGALTDLVATGRANLDGNGEHLRETLDGLSRALSTLADGRQDLFGTVGNLQQFTTALARSDEQVRVFNARLAEVAGQLAAEREELAAALRNLGTALAEVASFVRQHRAALESNVDALADITTVLVRQQRAIIDILDIAPLALSNLNLAYNANSGTLDTRDNALGPYDPASYVCAVISDAVSGDPNRVPRECVALAQTLNARGLPMSNQLRKLLGLPANPSQPAPAAPQPLVPTLPDVRDLTLGGILRSRP